MPIDEYPQVGNILAAFRVQPVSTNHSGMNADDGRGRSDHRRELHIRNYL